MNQTVTAVLLTYGLIYGSRLLVLRGQAARPEGFDNANPRAQQQRLEGMAARALGAHNNAFEAFAPFAAAAIFASLGPAYAQQRGLIDGLAWAHFALRIVYTGLYVGDVPSARTAVWLLGQGCTVALFIIALRAGLSCPSRGPSLPPPRRAPSSRPMGPSTRRPKGGRSCLRVMPGSPVA